MKIPIAEIELGEVREVAPEAVNEIKESIQEHGLLHPVTVQKVNGKYRLATGLKRLMALQQLGHTEVEAVELAADKDPEEIHLHEDLKRANLPWHEEVELKKRLHDLRQRQHGKAPAVRPSPGAEKAGWGMRDTARELGESLGTISEDLNLAEAVRLDPTLKGIKDKQTAKRMARVKAKRITAENEASIQSFNTDADQVWLGSSAEVLKNIPDLTFDGVLTDPPWIEFIKEELTRDKETLPVFKEVFRTLKWDRFIYMFVGLDDFYFYRKALADIGFRVYKVPLIWLKKNIMSRSNDDSWRYSRDFELVLVAAKGKPAPAFLKTKSSIFDIPAVPPKNMVHPNEKPIPLLVQLLEDFTFDGQLILDPFGGSGNVGKACKLTKRRYVLIERDKKFHDQIVDRLK